MACMLHCSMTCATASCMSHALYTLTSESGAIHTKHYLHAGNNMQLLQYKDYLTGSQQTQPQRGRSPLIVQS